MNEENKQRNSVLMAVITYVLAIGANVGMFTLGALARSRLPGAAIAYGVCTGVLILLMAAGWLGARAYGKQLKKQNVRQINAQADQRQQRMQQDPVREWKKLRLACIVTVCYVTVLWLLCLSIPFFYGASGLSTEWLTADLIAMFFLSGLVGRLIRPFRKKEAHGGLPEKDFPRLYALVREAGGTRLTGKKFSIQVLHGIPDDECNAALAIQDHEIALWIGAVLLCVLDEAELKQVLLHEFAHMDKGDISQNKLYNRVMGYLNAQGHSFFSMMSELALSFPAVYLYNEGQFFFLLSSRDKESRADHRAASQGDREKQSSALAKISAHDLFIFENEPYDNLFVSEKVPQHLMTDRARAYRAALIQREQDWRHILENEIPSRVATHPTFRQRWEALGCCAYSLMPADTDTDFARECWAAAETADAERASIPQEKYDRMRKEMYLDPMAAITEYESDPRPRTPDELREPMLAYYSLGIPEKMEALCDQIISEHDSPFSTAFSRYWKGILLLRRYDKRGLEFLYQAMEANPNYIDDGLNQIGSYCTRMGLQAELEEYRSRAPEYMQLKVDRASDGITGKADLSPASLPEGWLEKIRDFIVQTAGADVSEIYLVKETVSEDYAPSAFVLRFREETGPERRDEIYEKVFRLLDDWPMDWEFSLYTYEDGMEKPLNRVSGARIYPQ